MLVFLAFSPSRWAFSERAVPDVALPPLQLAHQTTRTIKADIGSLSTRSTFDRRWTPEPGELADGVLVSRAVNFAAADPLPEPNAPFDALLADPEGVELILRGTAFGAYVAPDVRLPLAAGAPDEQKCLADAIYFEARGETRAGQAAVAQVVLNRVKSRNFPNTICGVVYQNQDQLNRCQFSFACDGASERITDRNSWRRAMDVARQALAGGTLMADVGNATHYHATYVRPVWASEMRQVDTIGRHVFYETGRRL